MSLFSKLIPREVRSLAPQIGTAVGTYFGGPIGGAIGGSLGGSLGGSYSAMPWSPPAMVQPVALPALGGIAARLGTMAGIGTAVGVAVGRGRTIMRAAGALCLKHPQWCSTIGGTAAIAALMESGQLPVPRRRRGRGLTPRDLRSFRRVASLIRGFCPTVRRIPPKAIHARRTGIVHA